MLLLSTIIGIGSMTLLVFADSFVEFLVVCALQGVFRALDSGPLEAWYVDATLAADPNAKLERGLSGRQRRPERWDRGGRTRIRRAGRA